MHLSTLAAFLVSSHLVAAIPVDNKAPKPGMRLIKTGEDTPAIWVTEQEKFDNYTAKDIGFFDITDVDDESFLKALSTKTDEVVVKRQSRYPSQLLHKAEAQPLVAKVSTAGPKQNLKTMTDFFNRHYQSATGRESSDWLFNKVKEMTSGNSAFTVRQVTHRFNQPSIIATWKGTKSDLVIIGAHFDSTAGSASRRSPGADDNASGTSVVLETLRVLTSGSFKPTNTLEFHFYAGEEGGLLGSQDIYRDYARQGKSVKAFVNKDMAGYSKNGNMAIFEDYTDAGLSNYCSLVAEGYLGVKPQRDTCGYGCSDHASATANGFPSAMVHADITSGTSPYIHSDRDAYNTIMWDAIERHAKFSVGFMVEASYL